MDLLEELEDEIDVEELIETLEQEEWTPFA